MRPITRITPNDGYKVLVPGDIHGGIQDDDVLGLLYSIGKREKVDALVLIGDTHDCAGVSEHNGDVDKYLRTLEDEDKAISWFTKGWKGAYALAGNHEKWVLRFLKKNPGLTKNGDWHSPFPLTYSGVKCLPYEGFLKIGHINFEHGHELKGSLRALSARTVWQNYPGQNTVYGHCHRQDQWVVATMKDGRPEPHGAHTIGHCSRPEAHRSYAADILASWAQGGAMIQWFKTPSGALLHRVDMLTVLRDRRGKPYIIYNGNLYK